MKQVETIRTNVTLISRELRMPLVEVAGKAGMSYTALYKFLSGGEMKIGNVCRIAEALNTTLLGLARVRKQ